MVITILWIAMIMIMIIKRGMVIMMIIMIMILIMIKITIMITLTMIGVVNNNIPDNAFLQSSKQQQVIRQGWVENLVLPGEILYN